MNTLENQTCKLYTIPEESPSVSDNVSTASINFCDQNENTFLSQFEPSVDVEPMTPFPSKEEELAKGEEPQLSC